MSLHRSYLACVILLALGPVMLPRVAWGANILWDGTGTSWNTTTTWSLFSNATTPNPAAKPGASDIAIFNIETVNTSQTVNLNAAQAAQGLSFNSTGSVTIQTGTGTNTLTLGSGGITVNSGAGANTISNALNLSAPQSWINNSSNLLTIGGSVAPSANNLTVGGGGNTLIGGTLSGSNGLSKTGAGQLALGTANTFTGGVAISAGNVMLGHAGALNSSTPNAVAFGPGSTGSLSLFGNNVTVSGLTTDATVGTPIVQNGSSTTSATLTVNNTVDMVFGGVLQNGGSQTLGLTKSGAGTLTLTGSLPYTGATTILGGTLKLEGADNPLAGGIFTVNTSGAAFDLNGRSAVLNKFSLEGNIGTGGLKNSASGNSTLTIPFSGIFDFAFYVAGGNEGFVEVTQSDGSLTLEGRLNGNGRIYKQGAGTLILKQSSVGFQGSIVVEQGMLAIGHDLALGSPGEFGGRLTLSGGVVRADGGARVVANRVALAPPGGTFTGSDDLTLTDIISGTGHLTKQGNGRLVLNSTNTYSGGTTVDSGVLVVNGSIPGATSINAGATLQGSGSIEGTVTLASGGIFAPGNGSLTSTMSVDSLSLNPGATIGIELAGTTLGSGYDHVNVAGALDFGGALHVSLVPGFNPSLGQLFDLFNWSSVSGTFSTVSLPPLDSGLTWNKSLLYTAGVIFVAAGLPGDFDNDGDVDGRDFLVWQRGESPDALSAGDLAVWQAGFGAGTLSALRGFNAAGTPPANAVPEPGGFVLILWGLVFGWRRVWAYTSPPVAGFAEASTPVGSLGKM